MLSISQQICHLDRSVPGFPAMQHSTMPRVRLSAKRGAGRVSTPRSSTGNPGERSGEICGPTKSVVTIHQVNGSPVGTVECSPRRESWVVTPSTSSPEGTAENYLRPHRYWVSAVPSGLPWCFSAACSARALKVQAELGLATHSM